MLLPSPPGLLSTHSDGSAQMSLQHQHVHHYQHQYQHPQHVLRHHDEQVLRRSGDVRQQIMMRRVKHHFASGASDSTRSCHHNGVEEAVRGDASTTMMNEMRFAVPLNDIVWAEQSMMTKDEILSIVADPDSGLTLWRCIDIDLPVR